MRIVYALSLVLLIFHLGSTADARAQSARRGSYYNRMTTGSGHAAMAVERGVGVGSLERTSARSSVGSDLLSPYSSHATTAYSSEPPAERPAPRPLSRPTPKNYYPTARIGQSVNRNVGGGHHCTPSRAGALGR
jgi:hypothetical protein